MMEKVGLWFEERMGWKPIWKALALRNIPKVNWAYTLGSATLLVMINQILTGILLTIYYVPSPQDAYSSVAFITNEITAGWLIRGLHHWGASAMVVLAGLHMIRVVVHGAYKFPREVTWFTGLGLLAVTLAFGFTGYLLPWDQKAYWATTVGTRMLEVTPVIGEWLLRFARGGEELIGCHPHPVLRNAHMGAPGNSPGTGRDPYVPRRPDRYQRTSQGLDP